MTNSYLAGGIVLEFDITVPDTKYIRLGDMELVLPIRFRQEQSDERINLSKFIQLFVSLATFSKQ